MLNIYHKNCQKIIDLHPDFFLVFLDYISRLKMLNGY